MYIKTSILALCFVLSVYGISQAEELIISGTYMGKNLYVQNPFSEDQLSFCTQSVYVNDRLVLENPVSSAFEVDLSFLPLNTPLEIRLVHKPGCAPQVVNVHVINYDSRFKFLTLNVDEETVKWITEHESNSGTYFIERLEDGEWIEVGDVGTQGKDANNFYKLTTLHKPGPNTYRIKLMQPEGLTIYSREVSFPGSSGKVKISTDLNEN